MTPDAILLAEAAALAGQNRELMEDLVEGAGPEGVGAEVLEELGAEMDRLLGVQVRWERMAKGEGA